MMEVLDIFVVEDFPQTHFGLEMLVSSRIIKVK